MIFDLEVVVMWLLIFIRITSALTLVTIMIQAGIPNMTKVGLSIFLTTIVFLTVAEPIRIEELQPISFAVLILKEVGIGLIIGFSMNLLMDVYHFVGQLLSVQSGLSMGMIFDLVSNTQVTILGKFLGLGFMTIFITSGGLHWFVKALVESFRYIPVGSARFEVSIVGAVIQAITVFFVVSVKIAAPILGVLFMMDCSMGILARAVPQMNMFVIGIPLKILILFLMLIITFGLMSSFNELLIENIKEVFFNIVQGMVWQN